MSYTIKISTTNQTIGDSNDTVQLIITFTVNLSGSNVEWNAADKGIYVDSWPEPEWDYDFEDLLLVPGVISTTLGDRNGELKELLFGTSALALATEKKAEVEFKINSNTVFIGDLQEDSIFYNDNQKKVSVTADPNTQVINSTTLYNDGGVYEKAISNAVHSAGVVTVTTQSNHGLKVNDSIQIFNVAGMTDLNGYWHVATVPSATTITIALTTAQTYTNDGSVKRLESNNPFLYNQSVYTSVITILEDIYKLANPSISYAGGDIEINHDWVFEGEKFTSPFNTLSDMTFDELYQLTDPLYFNPGKGLTNTGDILKKLAVDWCCYTGLIHKQRAFFRKMFYYDSANLQTLEKVISREFNYAYQTIDYVKVTTDILRTLDYEKGVNTLLEGKSIIRDALPGFFQNQPSPTVAGSNVRGVVDRSAPEDGTYLIYQVKDPNLLSAAFVDNGELISEFWYNYRSNLLNCRIDKIVSRGIDYDFLKNFNDDGKKYQIISMKIRSEKNITEFQSIYLGEV